MCGLLMLICATTATGQEKAYSRSGNKIITSKTSAEANYLTVTSTTLSVPTTTAGQENMLGITEFLPIITKGIEGIFKVSAYLIEKNLKAYTGEYSARNINRDAKKKLPKLTFARNITIVGDPVPKPALKMVFEPVITHENLFAFELKSVDCNYSKAKLKAGYPIIDLTVEIAVTYYDGNEKKTQTSTPLVVHGVNVRGIYSLPDSIGFYSDNFPSNKRITEIHMKVVETNPYKIRAEKLKELSDKFGDDAKELAKGTVNIFVGSDKKD